MAAAVRATQTWQPQKYLKFQQERLRPALDLLACVSSLPSVNENGIEIVDLGAGTGNMTPVFLKRWPNAHVTFVDSATSMLEVAQRDRKENKLLNTQQLTYAKGDFETFSPGYLVDLIFSNAVLQWEHADKHKDIMSRLYSFLKPGGVLAFQIPDTRLQPNYSIILEATSALGLSDRVAGVRSVTCQHNPDFYYDLFKTTDSDVELDIWVTVYAHILEGDNPVADFTGSTGLRPFMRALAEPSTDATQFKQNYRELIANAYPKQSDGSTIFNFKRFFVTATKPK